MWGQQPQQVQQHMYQPAPVYRPAQIHLGWQYQQQQRCVPPQQRRESWGFDFFYRR
jgi:hypothetical protein